MDHWIRDIRHALRRLARSPGFTAPTIVTLGLGIGAYTAIFSVVYGVLLQPLPFRDSDRLIGVWQTAPGVKIKDLNASIADYVTYREHSQTFEDVALWNTRAVTVTEFDDPERVDGMNATWRLLPMLGVRPLLGRDFNEEDGVPGKPDVMMLSHAYWQRRFGGDPNVIGRRILADGTKREIIGVLPKDFWFMDAGHAIVLPLRFDRATVRLAGYNFQAVARLRPGVTLDQANADVARMIAIALRKFPPPVGMSVQMMEDARLAPNVRPLMDDLTGDIGRSLWVVMATTGIVLLIACANVANLLLVRAEGRTQELAVRTALGASKVRVAGEMLAESLALALLGGFVGVGFAIATVRLVVYASPARLPRFEQIAVGGTALLFTLAISVLAGVIFGIIPMLRHNGVLVSQALRAGGRNASAGRERNAARNALTSVQVALALVLLIGSGLMIRTFQSMRRVQPGFSNVEELQTLRVTIPRTSATKDAEVLQLQRTLTERLSALPGISSVGLMSSVPMTSNVSQDPVFASDRQYAANQIPPLRRFVTAAPGAFRTLGATLLAGREFTWTEIMDQRRVVIVGENFAREYWGSAAGAVGKQIRSNPTDPWSEIVGVVGDIRHDGVDKKAPSSVYWPLRSSSSMAFVVRPPRAGSESLVQEIRQTVWAANSTLPITEMRTMKEVYDRSMARTAFTLTLLAISGGMALILAAVGIYAVISYTVAQRTREIGIRMALGAQQSRLKLFFVRRGLLWAGIGVAAGLTVAAGLSRIMTSLLFDVSPLDAPTYITVAVGLLIAAALASYLPARRIVLVNPSDALRSE